MSVALFLNRARLAVLAFLVTLAAVGAIFTEIGPSLNDAYCSPSWAHPMGCSPIGEDMSALLLKGSWITLLTGIVARAMAVGLSLLGSALAFLGGIWTRYPVQGLAESIMSIPSLLLAMALAFVLPDGIGSIALAIGISEWAFNQRWLLGRLNEYGRTPWFRAAEEMGASQPHMFRWHVLPELQKDLVFLFFIHLPGTLLTVAALEFLGLTSSTGTPGLGYMIAGYKDYFFIYPHLILFPMLVLTAILLTSLRLQKSKS